MSDGGLVSHRAVEGATGMRQRRRRLFDRKALPGAPRAERQMGIPGRDAFRFIVSHLSDHTRRHYAKDELTQVHAARVGRLCHVNRLVPVVARRVADALSLPCLSPSFS